MTIRYVTKAIAKRDRKHTKKDKRIRDLEQALKPFAHYADLDRPGPDDTIIEVCTQFGNASILGRHLIRASELLGEVK